MIEPYKRNPIRPTVAILTDKGRVLDEHGRSYPATAIPDNTRVYVSYESVAELLHEGHGEALCWNGETVRWRPERLEQEWKPRPTDVRVLRIQLPEDPTVTVQALARWNNWLASYGAAPGSLGQSAFSLLRATLRRPLWLSCGQVPPITWTLGARIQLCTPPGLYDGRLVHFDLPAAYASTLGGIPYGGRWKHCAADSLDVVPADLPVFARARVTLPPSLVFGPLPRRPRQRQTAIQAALNPTVYPDAGVIQGVWTREEIQSAQRAGCKVRVLECWIHLPFTNFPDWERPFAHWWEAVQEGRAMRGWAGLLAKTTGNALWGQFCMSSGRRTVLTVKERRDNVHRDASVKGGRPAAHDLTETISGRVRAQLFTFMQTMGSRVLSVHTDGAWCRMLDDDGDVVRAFDFDWREKERAEWLQLISPQVLAYKRPADDEPVYVFAGIPFTRSQKAFQEYWQLHHGDKVNWLLESTQPLRDAV